MVSSALCNSKIPFINRFVILNDTVYRRGTKPTTRGGTGGEFIKVQQAVKEYISSMKGVTMNDVRNTFPQWSKTYLYHCVKGLKDAGEIYCFGSAKTALSEVHYHLTLSKPLSEYMRSYRTV